MKKINLLFLSLAVVIFAGCSLYHVDSKDTTLDFYPPKESADQIVYIENVQKPHQVIGYVTVNTERRQWMSEILEKMKREAAILGGDAITGISSDSTGEWKRLPAQEIVGKAYIRANFRATVVVFK